MSGGSKLLRNMKKTEDASNIEIVTTNPRGQKGRPKGERNNRKSLTLTDETAKMLDELRFELRYKFENDVIEDAIREFYKIKMLNK